MLPARFFRLVLECTIYLLNCSAHAERDVSASTAVYGVHDPIVNCVVCHICIQVEMNTGIGAKCHKCDVAFL